MDNMYTAWTPCNTHATPFKHHTYIASKRPELTDDIKNADAVITSATSAYLEAVNSEIRVLYVRDNFGMDYLFEDEVIQARLKFASHAEQVSIFVRDLAKSVTYDDDIDIRQYMADAFGSGMNTEEFFSKVMQHAVNGSEVKPD